MSARVRFLLAFVPPAAAGVLLRLWNLPAQVMGGDELHGVRAALEMRLGEILTTYLTNDNCIPLSAAFRLVLDAGGQLSEMAVRLPSLASGAVALVLIPAYAAQRAGRRVAVAAAWLAALSPMLVLYSRIARSYMPIVLLGLGAVMAFDAWWRGRGTRWAVAYSLLAALAIWFHLLAAPFVLAPFLYAAGELVLGRFGRAGVAPREGRGLGALVRVGLAVVFTTALLLAPALPSLLELVGKKAGRGEIGAAAVAGALRLQAGSGETWLAALFWLAAVAGFVRLLSSERRFAVYGATVVGAHLAAVFVLAPFGSHHPLIFNRYTLIALPLVLVWAAVGLTLPGELLARRWGRRGRVAGAAVAGAAVAVLFFGGPLADPAYRSSSFTHHNDFVEFYRPRARLPREEVPAFYRSPLPPGALLELPWPSAWRLGRSFYVYQGVHHRPVKVATAEPALRHEGLAFRNLADPGPEGWLASGARYLVLHRDLAAEEERLVDPWGPRGAYPGVQARRQREVAANAVERLEELWGPPDRDDGPVLVWDLERLRAQAGSAGGS